MSQTIIQEAQAQLLEEQQQQHAVHVSVTFYRGMFWATLIWWMLVKRWSGKHLYDVMNGSVMVCPSWMPVAVLVRLQQHRKHVFIAVLIAYGVGSFVPLAANSLVRILIASIITLYHLLESSVTNRHGEFPLLYNGWAMCCSSDYASALSLGIAIHFILSTGISKLIVGGGFQGWTQPKTMQHYLRVYNQSSRNISKPLLPKWNRWIVQRPWACRTIGVATILLECIIVPSTIFMPPNHLRSVMGTGSLILMHIGIFFLMSKQVGIAFCTTIPNYVVGFSCTIARPSFEHSYDNNPLFFLALVVAFLPTAYSLLLFLRGAAAGQRQLPEDWPLSPLSLFMWNGHQAQILSETLMTGETRIVLCPAHVTPKTIVGLPIHHHGAVDPAIVKDYDDNNNNTSTTIGQPVVVYDCVLRIIGFTILQGDLLHACPPPHDHGHHHSNDENKNQLMKRWNIRFFVQQLQQFLWKERRFYERQTGQPLLRAMFVRMDHQRKVQQVLWSVLLLKSQLDYHKRKQT